MIDIEKIVGKYINARFRSNWVVYGRVGTTGEGDKKTYTLEDACEGGNHFLGTSDHTYAGRIKKFINKNKRDELYTFDINPEAIDFYKDITDMIKPLYENAGKDMPGQNKI